MFSATQGCHQNGMRNGVGEGVDVSVDVVVVGGGAIGLASAWRLAQAGLSVTVCDPAPGSQATHASAGMLAPVTEAHYGEDRLLRLNLAAAERWPAFAAELEAESGLPVGYRTCGSLLVALDADDARVLEDLAGYLARLDLDAELLSGSASREVEPASPPGCGGACGWPATTRPTTGSWRTHCWPPSTGAAPPWSNRPWTASTWSTAPSPASPWPTGRRSPSTGPCSPPVAGRRGVGGLPADAVPPVRPVKGQILRIQGPADPPVLRGNVRGLVRGRSLYLVPRASGRIVVGATVEEQGFDTTVTVEGIHHLLHDAAVLVPGLLDLELAETLAGLRPGSPDNEPMVGDHLGRWPRRGDGPPSQRHPAHARHRRRRRRAARRRPAVPEIAGFGPERFRSGAAA